MRKMLFVVALIAAQTTLAAEQYASIRESVVSRGSAPVINQSFHSVQPPKAPSYCKPCLWYSGDFDPNNPNANGLANEDDQLVSEAHVYAAWTVKGATTMLEGAFVNSLDTASAGIDNPTPWEIRKHMSNGNCGKSVRHGKGTSTDTPTGRQGFGINEYTHRVKFKAFGLVAGTYWQNVTPQCFHNSVCPNARYFESSEDDDPKPLHHFGTKNLLHRAIWNSTTFGSYCANPDGMFGPIFQFSAGVLGTP